MADHPGKAILEGLLSRGEVQRERVRDITLPASKIQGYPFSNAAKLDDFHEYLGLAEGKGAVRREWRRYYEGTELKLIRLADVAALADFLGRPLLGASVDAAFSKLDQSDAPAWLLACLEVIRERWLEGKNAYGLSVDHADRLPALVQAICGIESLSPESQLDYRQFGARFLGDSKLTRQLEAPLAAIYRERLGLKDHRAGEVMAQINLVPLEHPTLLRGPLTLHQGEDRINADVAPYIGVPAGYLSQFQMTSMPAYILTIENQSSFNEYTRHFPRSGMVIYTAGYPTRALQRFYGALAEKTADAGTPLYHWGDTDVDGFRILKCLQAAAGTRSVVPHQMDIESGERYTDRQISQLRQMMPINPVADRLVESLAHRGYGACEQESTEANEVSM
ncbi:hypothetical protein TspCOW1_13070 [Thiohalobacter sp. COW1]|uniref:Wadjet anti-phage system protein JetD domain-containing protein n=1 Tax=Thiohalobacter sp. COW1 TaxID=2795687 RepID=UPI00191534F4|nr:Wadjet anti-phage system protein JetD domain-containing protein [Thiohalobacter sp. COW1]BCO31204.1 hypothetical protein TspCOW1_13070 [Thiohalobacter sp. COW1]